MFSQEVKSWSELDTILKNQTNTEKGDLFERFCKALLATHRQFCAEHVYLGSKIPIDEKERLRLPNKDLGHDGLLIKRDGTRILFQAKYRAQEHLTHTELSTFFNISEFADERLIIRTTDLSSQAREAIEKKDNTCQIDVEFLSQLDEADFKAIHSYMQGRGVISPEPRTMWPIQKKAIEELLAQPHEASLPAPERATCVMPCGTGKTLVAMRYAEAISAKRMVILLPSLMLVEQAIKDWCRDSKIPTDSFSFHVICSQKGRGERTNDDSIYIPKSNLAFIRSTQPSEVTDYLKKSHGQHQIIFCTYQSTQVLIEALKEEEQGCDLIIFDEAHRTAGKEGRAFSLALSDENIKATHRLYLTATPKHIDFQKKSEDGEYKTSFSMDDEAMYGQKVMIDYREAIKNDRICDYKVIVAVLRASEIARADITQSEVYDENHPDKDFDALSVAHEIALDRVMHSHGVKKIISFHKLIEDARSFAEETSSCMPSSLHCQYIKGTHTRKERADILKAFSDTKYGLLSNARCLTEGVNIPSVDCVAFLSPKRSKVDIIQAIGRAMRKDPNNSEKKTGYVLLPLLVEDGAGESEEEAVAATNFDEIWDVLGSLKEFDPILAKVFDQISEAKGANKDSNPFDLLNDHIEIIGTCLCSNSLKKEIGTRLIEKLISSWYIRFGELKAFKEKYGYCRVPKEYSKNLQLGSWCSRQRCENKKGTLSLYKIQLLDKLGFVWDFIEDQWRAMYGELKSFKEKHGHCNLPQKYLNNPLWNWAGKQRDGKKKGNLSIDKVKLLDELGLIWDLIEHKWQEKYLEVKMFKEKHGHCNVPKRLTEVGHLGTWCIRQRQNKKKGTLPSQKINLLDGVGFCWDAKEVRWNENYLELKLFKEKQGHCNAVSDINPENYQLKTWCRTQRERKKIDRLSDKRIQLLDEMGFCWNQIEYDWEARYTELKAFNAKNGHCNVPIGYSENLQLGIWCSRQRSENTKGTLSLYKIQLLDKLGFVWDLIEDQWRAMYGELKSFKEKHGHCDVPFRYPKNPQLGSWVCRQRGNYKKGKLSQERIELLESIGLNGMLR